MKVYERKRVRESESVEFQQKDRSVSGIEIKNEVRRNLKDEKKDEKRMKRRTKSKRDRRSKDKKKK